MNKRSLQDQSPLIMLHMEHQSSVSPCLSHSPSCEQHWHQGINRASISVKGGRMSYSSEKQTALLTCRNCEESTISKLKTQQPLLCQAGEGLCCCWSMDNQTLQRCGRERRNHSPGQDHHMAIERAKIAWTEKGGRKGGSCCLSELSLTPLSLECMTLHYTWS